MTERRAASPFQLQPSVGVLASAPGAVHDTIGLSDGHPRHLRQRPARCPIQAVGYRASATSRTRHGIAPVSTEPVTGSIRPV